MTEPRRSRALLLAVVAVALVGVAAAGACVLGGVVVTTGAVANGHLDEANVSATRIQILKIEEALAVYSVKHRGRYPSTAEGLDAMRKYFPNGAVPTDAWGNAFLYFSPGVHGDHPYEIISLGEDGREGGADADADLTSYGEG